MEGEAADDQLVLLLSLHWNGTVVIQLKDLPVEKDTRLRFARTNVCPFDTLRSR